MDRDNKILIAAGAGALLFYFGVLDPLLTALGIKKSQDTKDNDAEAEDPGSPWSPAYYKAVGGTLLYRSVAEKMAEEIYDAFGFFDDNEEQAIGVLKTIRFQSQLSFLADVFYQKYNQDLLTFLRGGNWPKDRLSDADVAMINSYIKKLPAK